MIPRGVGRSGWILVAGLAILTLFLGRGWAVSSTHRSTAATTVMPGSTDGGYIGRQACAKCHESKGKDHFASNHAATWMPTSHLDQVPGLPKEIQEGGIAYRVHKVDGRWSFTVRMPNRPAQTFPVHSLVGGKRFGLSFLLLAEEIEGVKLAHPTFIEGRYMLEAGTFRLKKSPGLFAGQPRAYNTAIGRVMSPDFADKCLDCHAGPLEKALADQGGPHPKYIDVGVGCERCHGAGADHVEAVRREDSDLRIVHPGNLPTDELLKICGQCHSGFTSLVQPRPEDTLISNQVTALQNSQCFIQSRGGLSCLDCHDPHNNATKHDPTYVDTCLRCHSESQAEAVHCPVNASDGCIGCHMPENVEQDNFHLTDHWIRVIRR